MSENGKNGKNGLYILGLVLLAGPFYLNDFGNMYIKDWRWWLFMDIAGVKLFPFLVALWLIYIKKIQPSDFGLTARLEPRSLVVFLVVALIGTVIDQNGYGLIAKLPAYSPLGGMPAITNPAWNWVDLTFRLLMVAILEELVFRGYMRIFLRRYTRNSSAMVVISSVAFGLIHWSLGLHAILITSIIGALLMIAYLITQSLPAIMLAHFTINFIDFAGVVPKSISKFV
jgi:membrane protease YdiL (CAAX protease family)